MAASGDGGGGWWCALTACKWQHTAVNARLGARRRARRGPRLRQAHVFLPCPARGAIRCPRLRSGPENRLAFSDRSPPTTVEPLGQGLGSHGGGQLSAWS